MANRFQQRSGTTEPDNTDLLDREFGVDTSAGKLYVRIGSSVHEVELAAKRTTTTTDPTVNDDASSGYEALRSIWYNSSLDKLFMCVDSTNGAAVWKQI